MPIHIKMMAMEPVPCHWIWSHRLEDCKCIVVVPEKVIDYPTINRESLIKVFADHARVLNVPGWSSLTNTCIQVICISFFISVPEDEISQIKLHSRIRIFMKSPFSCRPLRH